MTQVDHGECDVMSTQEVGVFPVKTDQQGTKLIDPGKTAFVREALPVDFGIEQAFASAFRRFTITPVLSNIRDDTVIETDLPCRAGVESAIGVEERTGNRQSQALDAFERGLQVSFQIERIVVIPRHDARRCHDVSVPITDGQDIARFGTLASLVGHALAAFLGNRMRAIQVQRAQVKVALDRLNARLPDLFQAPVGAPFAIVIVHRLPADFFFVASFGSAAVGNCAH